MAQREFKKMLKGIMTRTKTSYQLQYYSITTATNMFVV